MPSNKKQTSASLLLRSKRAKINRSRRKLFDLERRMDVAWLKEISLSPRVMSLVPEPSKPVFRSAIKTWAKCIIEGKTAGNREFASAVGVMMPLLQSAFPRLDRVELEFLFLRHQWVPHAKR